MLPTTDRWLIRTPLGAPVVPELNMMTARASSSAGQTGRAAARPTSSTQRRISANGTLTARAAADR